MEEKSDLHKDLEAIGQFILDMIDSGEFKFDENGDLLPPEPMSGDIERSSTTISSKSVQDG